MPIEPRRVVDVDRKTGNVSWLQPDGVSIREMGALFVIAVPGHEYLAKLSLGHAGPL